MAPRAPRGAEVQYLRLAGLFAKTFRERVLDVIGPLPQVKADVLPLARYDSLPCGCMARPDWLVAPYLDTRDLRTDASEYSMKFGKLSLELDGDISKLGGRIADVWGNVEQHNRKEMSRILQLDVQALDRAQAERFVRENLRLITSVKNYQLDRLERLVGPLLTEQARQEEIAAKILAQFDVTEARASLIARDQVLRLNSQLGQNRQLQAGVTSYIWTSSKDERVRTEHRKLDGRKCSWMIAPVVDPKTGRQAHPGADFQCRCVAVPLTDDLLYAE